MFRELFYSETFELQFEAIACIDEQYAFAAESQFNGLFQVDMKSGESVYLGQFPKEDAFGTRLFFSAVKYGESVFFSPAAAKHIVKYNIMENDFQVIELPIFEKVNLNSKLKFSDTFVFNDRIYFVGATYPYILELNPSDNKLEIFKISTDKKFLFRRGILIGNKYYIPSANSDIIMEFDTLTKKIIFHGLGKNKGAWSLCYDGSNFWIPPRYQKDKFIRWNAEKDSYIEIDKFPESYVDCDMNFIWIYYNKCNIYAIPEMANMIVQIDTGTLEIKQCYKIPNNRKMGFLFDAGNAIFLVLKEKSSPYFTQYDNQFLKLDKELNKLNEFSFQLINKDKLINDLLNISDRRMSNMCRERKTFGIEEFIISLVYGEKTSPTVVAGMPYKGKEIWNKLV